MAAVAGRSTRSLDRMVTITPEAIAKIEQLTLGGEPMDWFVIVSWGKGAADNRRGTDGGVTWDIAPDEGWIADLAGWKPGKVPAEEGAALCGSVRLLVQNHFAPGPFPGGEIYVDEDRLKVRVHAI